MKKNKAAGFRTMIGGQAIIEGIMMRGPDKLATVVRGPEGLNIKVESPKLLKDKCKVFGWPFIRGVVGLAESMKLGIAALNYSAEFFPEEEQPSKLDVWIEKRLGWEKAQKVVMGIALVIGIALPIALFILLPTLIAGVFEGHIGSGMLRNLLEGGIRLVIFLAFMFAVSKMKDIKRLFAYHGAEHKTIHCYENNLELTVENVKKFPRQHPRCGTSLLLVVMITSILVFSFVTWSNPFVRMALRLALLPVVMGISYEFNRIAGRYDNLVTRILRAPGIWLQSLTTNEPDDSMIEVGIEALKRVIPETKGADKW